MKRPGLILFAHGARDASWAQPFEAVAEAVRNRQPGLELRLAFLEFMAPDLAQAGAELAAAGCTHVQVLPLFLGTGGHLKRDLPPMVEQLRLTHSQTTWSVLAPAGEHAQVMQAMADVALQAVASA